MTSREKQLALVNEWLAQNPGESLTSLARRADLATTTLTRWANSPAHPQQILKSNTFSRLMRVMSAQSADQADFSPTQYEKERAPYFSDPNRENAPLAEAQTSALVYQIPRPVHSSKAPFGSRSTYQRAIDPKTLRNSRSHLIWAEVQSNAMEPSIPLGAFVLVERDVSADAGSCVYLVAFEGMIDLRRLDIDFENIIISADRPGYNEHSVHRHDIARLQILGRAICVATQAQI